MLEQHFNHIRANEGERATNIQFSLKRKNSKTVAFGKACKENKVNTQKKKGNAKCV